MGSRTADHLDAIGEDPAEDNDSNSDTETVASQNTEGNRDGGNFLTRPYWLNDEGLKKGEVDVLSMQEELFWKDLLEKYLYPIDEDKTEKVKRSNLASNVLFYHFDSSFLFYLILMKIYIPRNFGNCRKLGTFN